MVGRQGRRKPDGAYIDGGSGVWLAACALCDWRFGPTGHVDRAQEQADSHDIAAHDRRSVVRNRQQKRAERLRNGKDLEDT